MSKEIYGCLVNNTLTIYYDEKKNSREGDIFSYNEEDAPEWINLSVVRNCNVDNSVKDWRPKTLNSFFYGLDEVTHFNGLENINTEECINLSDCFMACRSLRDIDLSMWDTSKVWNANNMFASCVRLKVCNLSNWDMRNNSGTACMFEKCASLKRIDLSTWNYTMKRTTPQKGGLTSVARGSDYKNVNKVLDSQNMFSQCVRLKEVFLPEKLAKAMKSYGPQIDKDNENACIFYVGDKPIAITNNKKLWNVGTNNNINNFYLDEHWPEIGRSIPIEKDQGSRIGSFDR